MLRITDARIEDLGGILELQKRNLKINLSAHDIKVDGFVTLNHDENLLRKMNTPYPHTIAIDDSRVVGYALTMLPDLQDEIPQLQYMFDELIAFHSYVVMGQVCIDKDYRSKGIFRSMFEFMKVKFRGKFDYIVTEVALENERSLSAHRAIGFRDYCSRADWVILSLEVDK